MSRIERRFTFSFSEGEGEEGETLNGYGFEF